MILIELVYEAGCPTVAAVRANLAWALLEAGVSQRWTEWMGPGEGLPARVRGLPSPTILINSHAVEASDPFDAATRCTTVPSVSTIAKVLVAAWEADPDIPRRRMTRPTKRRREQQ